MISQALLFGLLVALSTGIFFIGLWRVGQRYDRVNRRLTTYGSKDHRTFVPLEQEEDEEVKSLLVRLLRGKRGLGLLGRLEADLSLTDISLTAHEYLALILMAALVGFALGAWRGGLLFALLLGGVAGAAPLVYLRTARDRRRRAITEQLPDVVSLLTGALRAGYGLVQALRTLAEELPEPANKEFDRAVRAISLGVPVKPALQKLSERVGTDDMDLVVTAIVVQHEMGGNLAETLEAIGDTIQDRIDIQREIHSLTSEERLSSYIISALPTVLGLVLFMMKPDFMRPLFEPGIMRLVLFTAIGMQIAGFIVTRRLTRIEV
jgi:tight adherence protein B